MGVWGLGGVGILLGPERTGTDFPAWVGGWGRVFLWRSMLLIKPGSWVVQGGGCGCGFCVLFEICIVDASIFVVKLLRADGGCLGTRSR